MLNKDTGEIDAVMEISALLIDHLNGRSHEEISREFHQLVEAVQAHGKKGVLTIAFTVEPPASGTDGAPIGILIESAVKAPKPSPLKAIYFVDGEGNPTRQDPRQMAFDLRDKTAAPTEFRSQN